MNVGRLRGQRVIVPVIRNHAKFSYTFGGLKIDDKDVVRL